MRIVKSQAVSVLRAENSMLKTQMARCDAQMGRLSRFALQGMRGKAAARLEQTCRGHAAIAASHLVFYESLVRANTQNITLVEALPETSAGVLDTQEAQRRLNDAKSRLVALQQERDQAIQLAERTNEEMRLAAVFYVLGSAITPPPVIDTSVIRRKYDSLIGAEELLISLNRQILEEVASYEKVSANLYGSVNTDALQCAAKAGNRFVNTGTWGDDAWIGSVESAVLFLRDAKTSEGTSEVRAFVDSFLSGGLKLERSVVSYDGQASGAYADVPITGGVSGTALGLELSLKPYAKGEDPKDEKDKKKAKVGVKAEGEVYAGRAEVTGSVGLAQGAAEITALSGAASGTVGASLFSDGSFDPSLELEAKGEASALKAQTTARLGVGDYNAHGKAEGQLFTASAKAGLEVSDEQIGAKAGAEAYVATGEISAGITLVGVKVDVALEGKVGGAGAHADASVGTSAIEGSVGAGLGLGAGIKVKVDWSGAGKALARMGDSVGEWWDELGGTFVSQSR